jgi:phosphohistidine phosphatase
MALYLVQHGKSRQGEKDSERGLSDEGREEVERIAGIAQKHRIALSVIIHSGKKRALETAEIFSEKLGPGIKIAQAEGMDPNDDVIQLSAQLDAGTNAMYVGHLPFMEKLASYLITGRIDKTVFKFQNGGLVCFDRHPETGGWMIKWALVPHIA